MSPAIGYLIVTNQMGLALGSLAVAATTDLLDGYIARRFNQKTYLGSALDPAADKVLMTTLTVSLCQAGLLSCMHALTNPFSFFRSSFHRTNHVLLHYIPAVPLASLIIGRDVGLILGAMYYRYLSLPDPVCICFYKNADLLPANLRY
jgi:cardiolipin synthase